MKGSLGILCLALVLAASSQAGALDLAEARLSELEAKLGGRLGVAALNSADDKRIQHRAHERFPMCSTFKLLAVAAVLHRVDEKLEQLTRFVTYTRADLLEYAPVTTVHVEEGGMTLSALCAAAIQQSDNTAANLLLKIIGGPEGLTRYARSLGDKDSRLDRVEPSLNSALAGDERDTTTPAAMLEDLRTLLLGDALTPAARDQLNNWLAGNETGRDLLRAGMPKDWKIGDKTGRGANGATNDIAILRPPGGQPILVAVYSVGSTASPGDRQKAIAEVGRLIVETFE